MSESSSKIVTKNPVERFFFSGVHPARPYLILKGVLLLLAFDCWLLMVSHGGRYNVANFNVAHFEWLDRIQPTPTSAIYVGTLLLCGVLSLSCFLVRPKRWVLVLVTLLYTWAWASSMLDSYQHHYLLSLVLVNLCCFPLQTAGEIWEKKTKSFKLLEAWGFVSLGVTAAIVYGYTAITKLGADWRQGHALKRLTGNQDWAKGALRWFEDVGFLEETFWGLFALSAICVQLTIALGYLLTTQQDRFQKKKWFYQLFLFVALFAAISFHIGVESIQLEIGWFSYYMIWLAFLFFLPARVVEYVGAILIAPTSLIQRIFSFGEQIKVGAVLLFAGGFLSAIMRFALDIPGGMIVGWGSVLFLLIVVVDAFKSKQFSSIGPWSMAVGVSVFLMWASIVTSDVRFDFYRYTGYDLRKRGQYEEALEAYIKANQYAPEGKDRKRKEVELRRIVESRKSQ